MTAIINQVTRIFICFVTFPIILWLCHKVKRPYRRANESDWWKKMIFSKIGTQRLLTVVDHCLNHIVPTYVNEMGSASLLNFDEEKPREWIGSKEVLPKRKPILVLLVLKLKVWSVVMNSQGIFSRVFAEFCELLRCLFCHVEVFYKISALNITRIQMQFNITLLPLLYYTMELFYIHTSLVCN